MFIQSKFHDYYDAFLRPEQRDPALIYQRSSRAVSSAKVRLGELASFLRCTSFVSGGYGDRSVNLVVFCGKIYPVGFFRGQSSDSRFDFDYRTPYVHFPPKKYVACQPEAAFGQPHADADALNKLLAPIIYITPRFYRSPEPNIFLNPRLQDIFFPMNGGEVVQSLMGFLSPRDPDMVAVSSKVRIAAHGYDNASFRREKGGPTRKRAKSTPAIKGVAQHPEP